MRSYGPTDALRDDEHGHVLPRASGMPALEIFQSLWAMERRRPDRQEWSLEQQFEMIAEAGFDGAGIDYAAGNVPAVERARSLFRSHGLGCLVTAFPRTTDDVKRVLDVAVSLDARMLC